MTIDENGDLIIDGVEGRFFYSKNSTLFCDVFHRFDDKPQIHVGRIQWDFKPSPKELMELLAKKIGGYLNEQ